MGAMVGTGPGGIERWRQTGSVEVFHYAENKPRRLNFEFYEDAQRIAPPRGDWTCPS